MAVKKKTKHNRFAKKKLDNVSSLLANTFLTQLPVRNELPARPKNNMAAAARARAREINQPTALLEDSMRSMDVDSSDHGLLLYTAGEISYSIGAPSSFHRGRFESPSFGNMQGGTQRGGDAFILVPKLGLPFWETSKLLVLDKAGRKLVPQAMWRSQVKKIGQYVRGAPDLVKDTTTELHLDFVLPDVDYNDEDTIVVNAEDVVAKQKIAVFVEVEEVVGSKAQYKFAGWHDFEDVEHFYPRSNKLAQMLEHMTGDYEDKLNTDPEYRKEWNGLQKKFLDMYWMLVNMKVVSEEHNPPRVTQDKKWRAILSSQN